MSSLESAEQIISDTKKEITAEDIFINPEKDLDVEKLSVEGLKKLKKEEERLNQVMILLEAQAETVRNNLIKISVARLNKG